MYSYYKHAQLRKQQEEVKKREPDRDAVARRTAKLTKRYYDRVRDWVEEGLDERHESGYMPKLGNALLRERHPELELGAARISANRVLSHAERVDKAANSNMFLNKGGVRQVAPAGLMLRVREKSREIGPDFRISSNTESARVNEEVQDRMWNAGDENERDVIPRYRLKNPRKWVGNGDFVNVSKAVRKIEQPVINASSTFTDNPDGYFATTLRTRARKKEMTKHGFVHNVPQRNWVPDERSGFDFNEHSIFNMSGSPPTGTTGTRGAPMRPPTTITSRSMASTRASTAMGASRVSRGQIGGGGEYATGSRPNTRASLQSSASTEARRHRATHYKSARALADVLPHHKKIAREYSQSGLTTATVARTLLDRDNNG